MNPTTAAPMVGTAPSDPEGLAAVTALVEDVAAGITARDPDRCVARFAADARSVVASGVRSVGRDAIRQAHVDAFAARVGAPPAAARFVVLDVLFVRPDVAVVTTGAYPAGPDDDVDRERPPTVVTWVLVRDADGWWVASRQFTPVAT